MYYFYVLESLKNKSLYYGSTSDLKKRLQRHNNYQVRSTKSAAPYRIRYYESYLNLSLARKRELNIKKNWAAKEELNTRI